MYNIHLRQSIYHFLNKILAIRLKLSDENGMSMILFYLLFFHLVNQWGT